MADNQGLSHQPHYNGDDNADRYNNAQLEEKRKIGHGKYSRGLTGIPLRRTSK